MATAYYHGSFLPVGNASPSNLIARTPGHGILSIVCALLGQGATSTPADG